MVRRLFGGSWWVRAIPLLAGVAALYLLTRGNPRGPIPATSTCGDGVISTVCEQPDTGALVNRFGYTPLAEPASAGGTAAAMIPLDNYVLSWDRHAQWSKGVDQETELARDFAYAKANQRVPMLTLEPWPSAGRSSRTLLQDIVAGKYDGSIDWVCEAIRDYSTPVFVRWGHEMENVTGRYPWATTNASAYIAAYQYFVTRCRSIAGNISYMWSPAGNRNLDDYWPGADYVDYIGVTTFDYEAWELRYYGRNRSFAENFSERYAYVKGYGLPIIIAECNATGDGREAWLADALVQVRVYPDVKSLVLFTEIDPVSWGILPPPDWRTRPPTPSAP